jgi:hypothetical protein
VEAREKNGYALTDFSIDWEEAARKLERTEEFKKEYAGRAGVEGVHAQGVRRMGLRRSRYIGERFAFFPCVPTVCLKCVRLLSQFHHSVITASVQLHLLE